MTRSCSTVLAALGIAICASFPVSSRHAGAPGAAPAASAPSCSASRIDPLSYALTTRVQADIFNEERTDWWDGFLVGRHAAALEDLNFSATSAAERALQIDPHNLLAHGVLARQYVVEGVDAAYADRSWTAAFDNGGAVVWTATLHDVDYKSFFMVAFTRDHLRIYRYGELAGPYGTTMGMPKFVGGDRERFWRAMGGCVDPSARPEVTIPWSDVDEIRAGNWVLWFKLNRKATLTSDRGRTRTDEEIKVNLHGATGDIEVHTTRDTRDPRRVEVRPMGIGPLDFQQRVRFTLVKHVDPSGRIRLPKASRSAGW